MPKAHAAFLAFRKFFFFFLGGMCSDISGSFGFLKIKSFSPVFNRSTASAPTMDTGVSSSMDSRDRCGQLPFPENITLSLREGRVFFNMLKREQKIRLDIFLATDSPECADRVLQETPLLVPGSPVKCHFKGFSLGLPGWPLRLAEAHGRGGCRRLTLTHNCSLLQFGEPAVSLGSARVGVFHTMETDRCYKSELPHLPPDN